jgi:hypothetical protein
MDGFKKCTRRPAPSVCRFLQQNPPKAALCGLESNFRFNSEIRLNSEIAPCRLPAPEAEATVSVRAKTLAYAATPILTQNVPGYDPPSMRIF